LVLPRTCVEQISRFLVDGSHDAVYGVLVDDGRLQLRRGWVLVLVLEVVEHPLLHLLLDFIWYLPQVDLVGDLVQPRLVLLEPFQPELVLLLDGVLPQPLLAERDAPHGGLVGLFHSTRILSDVCRFRFQGFLRQPRPHHKPREDQRELRGVLAGSAQELRRLQDASGDSLSGVRRGPRESRLEVDEGQRRSLRRSGGEVSGSGERRRRGKGIEREVESGVGGAGREEGVSEEDWVGKWGRDRFWRDL
jgi:hypothetical protein